MIVTKFKLENFKTTKWSGGSTTELFIFPPEADFKKKNFDFRLSTATVEVEMSDFTPLVDVSRTLMVLEGQMTLSHQNHHSKTLNDFEVDEFNGGWQTKSRGKCVDFNLMTKGKMTGALVHLAVETNKSCVYNFEPDIDWVFLYAYSGAINLSLKNEHLLLNKGDMVAFSEFEKYAVTIETLKDTNTNVIAIQVSMVD